MDLACASLSLHARYKTWSLGALPLAKWTQACDTCPMSAENQNPKAEAPLETAPKAVSKVTPMMAQFLKIKEEVGPEALLFYRMGDFYELFFDDAVRAAEALDIVLTKRGKHQGQDIAMCGVPVHASDAYLQRLIKKGFRVAVCEQTEDPKEAKKRGSKSVVRREVVRLVTPGTLTEDSLLDARGSNFILALSKTHSGDFALAWADVSDGSFFVCKLTQARVGAEISALAPREIILSETLYVDRAIMDGIHAPTAAFTPLPSTKFDFRNAEHRLKARFDVASLDGFGDFSKAEISAAGALLDYLTLTQAGGQVQLSPPSRLGENGYVAIDPATRASLEIDRTLQGKKAGSLLSVIDRTVTGPGARELAACLARPLVDVARIQKRLDAVAFFTTELDLKTTLRAQLRETGDMARAVSRLILGRGGPRDLMSIAQTLKVGEQINAKFSVFHADRLPNRVSKALLDLSLTQFPELGVWVSQTGKALKESVPLLARDGGFIRDGYHPELDRLKALRNDVRKIIAQKQAHYAKLASVPTLKIKHNNVLGYFIEISPKYADSVLGLGDDSPFIHRQTLVSGVRFTTTELSELDAQISSAADKVLALELNIFNELVGGVDRQAETIRQAAKALARLDMSAGLADWAVETRATRPVVDESLTLKIEGGRHPVVEAILKKEGRQGFTQNGCHLDSLGATQGTDIPAKDKGAPRLMVITGPNMAGKSTYLRQNALMFILAQAGSFVPAEKAHIGVTDRIFSRVGASDDLSSGRSTFMVEMIETAAILNQADSKSFVILDEIGRGTATFDGLSIAWAAVEHLHGINRSRALFATHYHELTDLADALEQASNASLRAKEWNGDLIFLHDIQNGAADKSYGVQVAKLAGLPMAAVNRAREVLNRLEDSHDGAKQSLGSLPLFSVAPVAPAPQPSVIDGVLKTLDIDTLSPRDALDLLYDLKAKL